MGTEVSKLPLELEEYAKHGTNIALTLTLA